MIGNYLIIKLKQINLNPLENCKSFEEITLEENSYDSLDLRPLVSCQKLKTIRVDDVELKLPDQGIPGLIKC